MEASTLQGQAAAMAVQNNPFLYLFQDPNTRQLLAPTQVQSSYADGGLAGVAPVQQSAGGAAQTDPQTLAAMIQQMVASGQLPASALSGSRPQAGLGGGNGMQQAANSGALAPTLGLSPGRTPMLRAAAQAAGLVSPVLGLGISAMNDGQGAIAGAQQMAAMRGVTGGADTLANQAGAALSGATGYGGFSNYSGGLGGYGKPGVGGVTGMQDALDPGVAGAARAMSADAARAVQDASMNPATQNPAGYAAAVQAAMRGSLSNPANLGVGSQSQGGGSEGIGDPGLHADEGRNGGGGSSAGSEGMSGQGGNSNGAGGGQGGYAFGGVIKNTSGPYFARKMAGGSGLVKAITPGRADAVHTMVPRGGYVVPADVVSGIGQGNTIAGARRLTGAIKRAGSFRDGGRVESVPVNLSGGEFYIHPHHLAAIGRGSAQAGAAMMDHVVQGVRASVAQHAMQAPPPK